MIGFSTNAKIFLCKQPVDMRKGFEGLSYLVEEVLQQRILSGAYFVFINRPKNRMKIIYWDLDGLVIWYKRLEKGSFLRSSFANSQLSRREFFMLLEGIKPMRLQKRFTVA